MTMPTPQRKCTAPKQKGVVRIMRIFRLKKHGGRHGFYVVEHNIEYGLKKERVGLRGMWYGNNPLDHNSFGKVEICGMFPVGKAGRHMSSWMRRRI